MQALTACEFGSNTLKSHRYARALRSQSLHVDRSFPSEVEYPDEG